MGLLDDEVNAAKDRAKDRQREAAARALEAEESLRERRSAVVRLIEEFLARSDLPLAASYPAEPPATGWRRLFAVPEVRGWLLQKPSSSAKADIEDPGVLLTTDGRLLTCNSSARPSAGAHWTPARSGPAPVGSGWRLEYTIGSDEARLRALMVGVLSKK